MAAVNAQNLNELMEFDHVIEVHADGTVTDRNDIYAGEIVRQPLTAEGDAIDAPVVAAGWELLDGYSGQDRYSGPCMHPSEFIGGRIAQDILDEPGVYVALVLEGDYPDERWNICRVGGTNIEDTVTASSAEEAVASWCAAEALDPAGYQAIDASGSEDPVGWVVARRTR
jgi:hypothetical protein